MPAAWPIDLETLPAVPVYRGLDVSTCLALARSNSPIGRALQARAAALDAGTATHPVLGGARGIEARNYLAGLLAYEAAEARNRDAGEALRRLFQLAQAEAELTIADGSLAEVRAALARAEEEVRRGLPAQDARNSLRRQEIDLRALRVDALAAIERLNLALKAQLKLGFPADNWRIRPAVDWVSSPVPPDSATAVAIGLATRPQLLLLRSLVSGLDESTRAVAEGALSALAPLIGVASPSLHPLAEKLLVVGAQLAHEEPAAVTSLRIQAHELLAGREQAVALDVREALVAAQAGATRVAIARTRYLERKHELARVDEQVRHGMATAFDATAVRLELLKARSQWVDDVIERDVQLVKLEQAQGVLAGAASGAVAPPP
jgi:hypothetical protein